MKKVFLLMTLAVAMPVLRADCSAKPFSTVAVPVTIEFADPAHRAEHIYASLGPRLEVAEVTRPLRPAVNTIENGRLRLVFCASQRDYARSGPLVLTYGPRRIELVRRPVIGDAAARHRRTAEILLADQPGPDWLIVERAEWLVGADRRPRIDLTLHNYTKAVHPGVELTLDFSNTSGECFEGPVKVVALPVSMALLKGRATVKVADVPVPSDVIVHEASVRYGRCANVNFVAPLGKTGQLEPGTALLIRYSFDRPLPRAPLDVSPNAIPPAEQLTIEHVYSFPYRSIGVKGDRVHPASVPVTERR